MKRKPGGGGKRSSLELLILQQISAPDFRRLQPKLFEDIKLGTAPGLLAIHALRFRLITGRTQAGFAELDSDLSEKTIQRIEQGRGRIQLGHVQALARACKIFVRDLFAPVDIEQLPKTFLQHPYQKDYGSQGSDG